MCGYVHMRRAEARRGYWVPRAEVTVGCEPPNMDAGN